jgi:hypothetical protein
VLVSNWLCSALFSTCQAPTLRLHWLQWIACSTIRSSLDPGNGSLLSPSWQPADFTSHRSPIICHLRYPTPGFATRIGFVLHKEGRINRTLVPEDKGLVANFHLASFCTFFDDRRTRTACCSVNTELTCQHCEPSSFPQPSLSCLSANLARFADQASWFPRVKEQAPRSTFPLGRRGGLLLTPNWERPSVRSRHTELTTASPEYCNCLWNLLTSRWHKLDRTAFVLPVPTPSIGTH